MVKDILPKILEGLTVDQALLAMGGAQISDQSELEKVVADVLKANPDVVQKIKNGKHKLTLEK